MDKDKTVQITVTLGRQDYVDLTDWANCHGRTPAEYAAYILAARVEDNMDTIDKLRIRHKRPI